MPRMPHVVVERAQARRRAGCRPTSRRPGCAAARTAASGSRDDELARDAREPRARARTPRPACGSRPRRAGSARTRAAYGSIEPLTSSSSTSAPRPRSPASRNARAHRLAAGAQRAAHRAAQSGVPRAARVGLAPARRRVAPDEPQVGHQPAGLDELGRRVRREVARAAAPRPGSTARVTTGASRAHARRRASASASGVGTSSASIDLVGRTRRRSAPARTRRSQNTSNARSYGAMSSGRFTSVARPAQ